MCRGFGYFSGEEVKKLQYLIAKEKALSGQVSGTYQR
jgi:hypothetical protein